MQGLARYVFQSGKSPRSWLVWLSFHHEPAWAGNLQVDSDVLRGTFPGGLYPIGTTRVACFLAFPGWKAAWAMAGNDMSL